MVAGVVEAAPEKAVEVESPSERAAEVEGPSFT